MFTTKTFAAIEVTPKQWKIAIASLNLDAGQIELIHTASYPTGSNLKTDIENFKVSDITYCVNNQYGMTFPLNKEVTETTFDFEKRSRSLQNQNTDYFNVGKSSILLSLPKNNADDLVNFSRSVKLPCSINHNDAVHIYGYKRNYGERSSATSAIVNIQTEHVSIIVMQNNLIKSVMFFNIESDKDLASEILHYLFLSSEFCDVQKPNRVAVEHKMNSYDAKTSNKVELPVYFSYDIVIFSGETNIDFATEVRQKSSTHKLTIKEVDVLDVLKSGFISILNPKLTQGKRMELESFNYRYSTVINAIAMKVEKLGINLSLDTPDNTLRKSVPDTIEIRIEQDLFARAMTTVGQYSEKLLPAIAHQKSMIIIALITVLCLTSYRYYDYNCSIVKVQKQYTDEIVKEKSLTDIKKKYDNLKVRNNLINQRIKAVEAIQQTQLLVPTIMIDVQKLAYENTFHNLIAINQLSIKGAELTISGNALDKFKVASFASRLQQSNYEDVTPTKYTSIDAVQCSYEIACRHVGAVAGNPVRDLPPQTQLQRVQQITSQPSK